MKIRITIMKVPLTESVETIFRNCEQSEMRYIHLKGGIYQRNSVTSLLFDIIMNRIINQVKNQGAY